MSVAVACSHGGDAGGDPPPGPRRIPATCEGLKKKGRGRSTSMSLHQALSRNGNRSLPIEFEFQDQETYMPVGDNYKHFSRYIGNWIGSYVPMYYRVGIGFLHNIKSGYIPNLSIILTSVLIVRGDIGQTFVRASIKYVELDTGTGNPNAKIILKSIPMLRKQEGILWITSFRKSGTRRSLIILTPSIRGVQK